MRVLMLVVIALAMNVAGCSKNEAASAKCSGVHNGGDCKYCCRTNGASGSMLVSGRCSCTGGS